MFIATLETKSFTFQSAGSTAEEAVEAMREAWTTHVEQTDSTLTFDNLAEGVNVREIVPGQAYRDETLLVG